MPGKLGCTGRGEVEVRGDGRRERRGGGLGMAWGNGMGGGRKDGCGSREVCISTKGAILGFARDLILEGFPGPRRGSQIVPWAAEKRVLELALAHNHNDEYFAYHHRTFIWQWMEIETEIHIGTLDLTP